MDRETNGDEQLDLPYTPYQRGSDTSEGAAESIAPTASSLAGKVLALIRRQGEYGATRDEIEQRLGMLMQTVTARVRGLVLDGFIKDSGRRRLTRSGRKAEVLIARGVRGE